MRVYQSNEIRNVGLVGHGHCGKTTLAAACLFAAGATNRLTRVDEGNTITDFDDDEIQRKITISTAVAYVEWKKKKINLLDTPGFNIFINDTQAALVAADAALVVVDGVAGVEVQTEKVWAFCRRVQAAARPGHQQTRPRALELRTRAGKRPGKLRPHRRPRAACPSASEKRLHGRRGPDPHEGLHLHGRRRRQGQGRSTFRPTSPTPPRRPTKRWSRWWPKATTRLLEEFFEQGTLSPEHILEGLKAGIRELRLFPVMCASAVQEHRHRPDPGLHRRILPSSVRAARRGGPCKAARKYAPGLRFRRPLAAFVFKTVADPFAGRVSYFKVMSGVVKNDANLQNVRTGAAERLAHIGCLMGKTIQPVTELHAGDIGARGQAEGHAHRRHAGATRVRRSRIRAVQAARAVHRLRH